MEIQIKHITHVRTDTKVEAKLMIGTGWKMDYPWSEMRACFVMEPFPPITVHKFFSKGTGPHSTVHYGINSKPWTEQCSEVY